MTLEEKKKARYLLLKALYDATDGDSDESAEWEKVAVQAGLDTKAADGAITYLHNEGLLERQTREDIAITHAGVVEIEKAQSHPEKPTTYFPPVNIINIHGANNAPIQQGTIDSHQTVHLAPPAVNDIRSLLIELKAKLPTAGLTPDALKEVESDVASIEAQLNGPKPKKGIVKELLKNVGEVVKGAASKAFTEWATKAVSGIHFG